MCPGFRTTIRTTNHGDYRWEDVAAVGRWFAFDIGPRGGDATGFGVGPNS